MLDKKMLKDMPEGTVFAHGTGQDGEHEIRWVAVRGGIWDWCIYYHHKEMTESFIKSNGDKMCSESKIKDLVPCDDEAFALYRY